MHARTHTRTHAHTHTHTPIHTHIHIYEDIFWMVNILSRIKACFLLVEFHAIHRFPCTIWSLDCYVNVMSIYWFTKVLHSHTLFCSEIKQCTKWHMTKVKDGRSFWPTWMLRRQRLHAMATRRGRSCCRPRSRCSGILRRSRECRARKAAMLTCPCIVSLLCVNFKQNHWLQNIYAIVIFLLNYYPNSWLFPLIIILFCSRFMNTSLSRILFYKNYVYATYMCITDE